MVGGRSLVYKFLLTKSFDLFIFLLAEMNKSAWVQDTSWKVRGVLNISWTSIGKSATHFLASVKCAALTMAGFRFTRLMVAAISAREISKLRVSLFLFTCKFNRSFHYII